MQNEWRCSSVKELGRRLKQSPVGFFLETKKWTVTQPSVSPDWNPAEHPHLESLKCNPSSKEGLKRNICE